VLLVSSAAAAPSRSPKSFALVSHRLAVWFRDRVSLLMTPLLESPCALFTACLVYLNSDVVNQLLTAPSLRVSLHPSNLPYLSLSSAK
jgi:hypothetical protein